MSKYTELLSEYLENNELPAIFDDTLNLHEVYVEKDVTINFEYIGGGGGS